MTEEAIVIAEEPTETEKSRRCRQRYVIQIDSLVDPGIFAEIQKAWRMFYESGDMGLLILPPNCKLYRLQDAGPIEEVEVRGPDGKSHLLADKE